MSRHVTDFTTRSGIRATIGIDSEARTFTVSFQRPDPSGIPWLAATCELVYDWDSSMGRALGEHFAALLPTKLGR